MYTAVFMSPGLRTKVKPAVELMQALPTVILGFLAGLWLAPLVEATYADIEARVGRERLQQLHAALDTLLALLGPGASGGESPT